jgi:hypothetical protein
MRKINVDLETVCFILKWRRRINSAQLEQLNFRDRATTFTATSDQIKEWKFTGLSNIDFINFKILRKKRKRQG